jgi:amino acid transporter
MSHDIKKTTDIKVEVALARDVEAIEMNDMSASSSQYKDDANNNNTTTAWAVSVPSSEEQSKEQNDWLDGFRRADRRQMKKGWDRQYHSEERPQIPGDNRYFDIRAANAKTATSALARELKGRHLQMIAFGGAIGMSSHDPRGESCLLIDQRYWPLRYFWYRSSRRWPR